MPLKSYGVLKSRPVGTMLSPDTAHLEIHLLANRKDYRIALNVRSQSIPPELRYVIFKDFRHPFTERLKGLKEGITDKKENPDIALDYIRGNMFDYKRMKRAQYIETGDNELSDTIELYVDRAINTVNARIYAFGEYWGPEDKKDLYFGFHPGQGIHDIHMNQGNAGQWSRDNGSYQDGGMLIYFPEEDRWVAIFLAFQSQSFHTDEKTGYAIEADLSEENLVLIVAAALNPRQGDASISLLNRSDREVDIDGWHLADIKNGRQILHGIIRPGEYRNIPVKKGTLLFPESGGIITLIDDNGIKMNGVSYNTPDFAKKGYTIVF